MLRAGLRKPAAAPVGASPAPFAATELLPPDAHPLRTIGSAIEVETVLDPALDPIMVDEFRRLASAVHQAQMAQDLKVLTVASGTAEEGKSMTALNLALTLASSYHRDVLLIDADLRAPSLAPRLEIPGSPGLTEIVTTPAGAPWPLYRATTRLCVLTAGHPTRDPISRISSVRMKEFLADAREKFDTIIIDTPPVGPFPDAALLSAMADATILVVSAGMASYKVAQKAVEILGEERILGVVLNRASWAAFDASYGYYGRYRLKS